MDFVSLIITPVVESLMKPVKKHLGFFVSSKKYVKDMDARMKQLEDTTREVQANHDTAVVNTEVVPERVEPWLEDVKRMNERAKHIPTSGIGCFNVLRRYKAGKRSYNILKDIEDLEKRESKIKFTGEKRSLAKVGSTWLSTTPLVPGGTENFESRDLIFKDALKALQPNNESQKMIALCGMGGVGKTTMMEKLNKYVRDSHMFDYVVKLGLGQNSDPISLQRAVAEYINGKDLSETDKSVRADRLHEQFVAMSKDGNNNILIIMDDLWKEVDLKDVGLTSTLLNGFKLLFTSRFEYLCMQMGVTTNSIFRVGVLSDIEAKTLFYRTVGPSSSYGDDPELQKTGDDIVKKCNGLPIAITTIARILSGKIKETWERTLERLKDGNLKDLESITCQIFQMSYENLKEDDDKALFILIGLFPNDYDILLEELLRYAWGLNLFKDVKSLARVRDNINICVDNLIHANLLTKSEHMGCVKMHSLVRAFVLSNFSKVKQALIVNIGNMVMHGLTKDTNDFYERILLKCTSPFKFPADFTNNDNTSPLILMDGNKHLKFPEDLIQKYAKT